MEAGSAVASNLTIGRVRLPADGSVLVLAAPYLGSSFRQLLWTVGNLPDAAPATQVSPMADIWSRPRTAVKSIPSTRTDGICGRSIRPDRSSSFNSSTTATASSPASPIGMTARRRSNATALATRRRSSFPADRERPSDSTDSNGYMSSITSPGAAAFQFQYADGALTQEVDPRNGLHEFTYDNDGKLTSDRTPSTGLWTVTRASSSDDVTISSPQGTNRSYSFTEPVGTRQRTLTSATGLTSTVRSDAAGAGHITRSDGTEMQTKVVPDPRFGAALPYVSEETLATPAGLKSVTTTKREATFTAAGDPLNLRRRPRRSWSTAERLQRSTTRARAQDDIYVARRPRQHAQQGRRWKANPRTAGNSGANDLHVRQPRPQDRGHRRDGQRGADQQAATIPRTGRTRSPTRLRSPAR